MSDNRHDRTTDNTSRAAFESHFEGLGNAGETTLIDLLYDGFYLLFLLRNGHYPAEAEPFADEVRRYLDEFERNARKHNKTTEDIYQAKYALCAAIDETVLASGPKLREYWELRPLQLQLFGDHLAGEHFFDRLEQLRAEGRPRLEVLEVFYLCMLLGFSGRFLLEGTEKLSYTIARVGDEIASMKGKRAGFAPRWQPPDSIRHRLKREVPMWVVGSVCLLVAAVTVTGLGYTLSEQTHTTLAQYNDIVQMPPTSAHLTITLP
ncbi:type IVB secretion system protein IcmH/DotU [Salinisphaera sp. Q1T1-3]|uniref:type IVB secretion system protein IcmH/DotU n=1 Tax=Salinisphaera sp. Q1T1-3 TaxID=2321229 RepID=UPI000E70B4B9|nr:type IVB secretion system protein IcmH/DotU [Salinisphaera sp. Q1T1-3]RJS91702.1 DotU family type IV/VI secretion system protein [Salinisphaera sp. Q1T1-3]